MKEKPARIGSLVPTRVIAPPVVAASSARGRKRERCPVALVTGSGDHLTLETVHLLRRRLAIASLIALAPLAFFLVLNLTEADPVPAWFGTFGKVFHLLV